MGGNRKTENFALGQQSPEKLVRRAPILDANSRCGGRPGLLRLFRPVTAPTLPFFSHFLCGVVIAIFQYSTFVRRFPFFAFGVLIGLFRKHVCFFRFLDEKCTLRKFGVLPGFDDFRTQNRFCQPFVCGAVTRLL